MITLELEKVAIPEVAIPEVLQSYNQWVLWKKIWKEDRLKYTKIPIQINGNHASTTNPATWTTYQEARKILSKGRIINPSHEIRSKLKNSITEDILKVDGIGFVFTKNDP